MHSQAANLDKITIPEAAIDAVVGYLVVFVGLFLLMAVIILMGNAMVSSRKAAKAAPAAAVSAPAAPAPESKPAPGSAGEIKLYDVPDREAAMIMAIVADKMGKPLNELRFKSIKEVK